MSQDPEEPSIVVRHVTPEEFCAASNRAVTEGAEPGTTTLRMFYRPDGLKNDLAGVDDDLAARALDARQKPPLVIELDRPVSRGCVQCRFEQGESYVVNVQKPTRLCDAHKRPRSAASDGAPAEARVSVMNEATNHETACKSFRDVRSAIEEDRP